MSRKPTMTLAELRAAVPTMALGALVDALISHRRNQEEARRCENFEEEDRQRRTGDIYRDAINDRCPALAKETT